MKAITEKEYDETIEQSLMRRVRKIGDLVNIINQEHINGKKVNRGQCDSLAKIVEVMGEIVESRDIKDYTKQLYNGKVIYLLNEETDEVGYAEAIDEKEYQEYLELLKDSKDKLGPAYS